MNDWVKFRKMTKGVHHLGARAVAELSILESKPTVL